MTHVPTASYTARDRSPFLPPNLSIVLNLGCFSSSLGRSMHIRPILQSSTFDSVFVHDSHVSNVIPVRRARNNVFAVFNKLPSEDFHACSSYHSLVHLLAYSHNILCAYTLISVSVFQFRHLVALKASSWLLSPTINSSNKAVLRLCLNL
jgi:hypothetical protein